MNSPITTGKPVVFNCQQDDYAKLEKDFAAYVKRETPADPEQNPESFACGYANAKILEPGLSYRIVNHTLINDLEFNSKPVEQLHVVLHFYELNFDDIAYCKTGSTVLESNDKFYSIALMTNSFTQQNVSLKKGTLLKGLTVQISEDWLKNNIKNLPANIVEIIKQKECVLDFITAKQRKILSDIFNNTANSNLPDLFIKSRVLRLTEQFLENLFNRGLSNIPEFANQKDFQALIRIEHILLAKYNSDFPSIETLAKTAYMSESKLKQLFKKAYGMAIYQYYQKNRMHKAKELLGSRKHNISQVGAMLGYQNMSNFSVAFKKEFSCLPSKYQEVI